MKSGVLFVVIANDRHEVSMFPSLNMLYATMGLEIYKLSYSSVKYLVLYPGRRIGKGSCAFFFCCTWPSKPGRGEGGLRFCFGSVWKRH